MEITNIRNVGELFHGETNMMSEGDEIMNGGIAIVLKTFMGT